MHRVKNDLRYGITPAWAGKSMPGDGASGVKPDHPRVGGEKLNAGVPEQEIEGSPPRGRGKVAGTDFVRQKGGITPAWAGKSLYAVLVYLRAEDHPRVGGEKR